MIAKYEIAEALGESGLLLPQLVTRGLRANDRAKYYLTLLQACRDQALHPEQPAPDLHEERVACGENDSSLDALVAGSRSAPGGGVFIPSSDSLRQRLLQAVTDMLAAVQVASQRAMASPGSDEPYAQRLASLGARFVTSEHHSFPAAAIDEQTGVNRDGNDSLHLLVMDLHRKLNALQVQLAEELVDGAAVYAVAAEDKSLLRAFMAGVNATQGLKLEHPGLGTTATRDGDALVIQNDIGTTDAHVIVIHVRRLELSVTYTDVHRARLDFFKALCAPMRMQWSTASAASSSAYVSCLGRCVCRDQAQLEEALQHLGSRLVFLIDWNRARKRLSRFVAKPDAIAVLRWSAEHNVGHRAFLEAGGERLLYGVLERAAPSEYRYGARLDDVIGQPAAVSFLQSVLRITSDAWRAGRSIRFIRDEVQAELLEHLHESQHGRLQLAADHAALIAGLASLAHDAVSNASTGKDGDIRAIASRAKRWETKADDIVNHGRTAHRQGSSPDISQLLADADDAADGLEEVVFLLTLLPNSAATPQLAAIEPLGRLAVLSAYEYVKCAEGARHLRRPGSREDMHEFLVAVERLSALEHESDDAERRAEAAILERAEDVQRVHLLTRIAGGLEDSIDVLARCALSLKDVMLGDLGFE